MDYSFSVEVARRYGVDVAIFLKNLYWWSYQNAKVKRNIYDESCWSYNTLDAYTKIFPFWTKDQIRRIIKSARDEGLIKVANYNQHAYDRTYWYALTDAGLSYFAPLDMPIGKNDDAPETRATPDVGEIPQGSGGNPTPIPDSKPDAKQKIKTLVHSDERTLSSEDLALAFAYFLSFYPKSRKRNKKAAQKAFNAAYRRHLARGNTMTPMEFAKFLVGDLAKRTLFDWLGLVDNPEKEHFIPLPATYLNGDYWENELQIRRETHQKQEVDFTPGRKSAPQPEKYVNPLDAIFGQTKSLERDKEG